MDRTFFGTDHEFRKSCSGIVFQRNAAKNRIGILFFEQKLFNRFLKLSNVPPGSLKIERKSRKRTRMHSRLSKRIKLPFPFCIEAKQSHKQDLDDKFQWVLPKNMFYESCEIKSTTSTSVDPLRMSKKPNWPLYMPPPKRFISLRLNRSDKS